MDKKYEESSISELLNKKRTANRRNMLFEEKSEKSQIITAKEIEKTYIERVGQPIGGSQIYYVLKRHDFRKTCQGVSILKKQVKK